MMPLNYLKELKTRKRNTIFWRQGQPKTTEIVLDEVGINQAFRKNRQNGISFCSLLIKKASNETKQALEDLKKSGR
jgi:hypothetical protein